MYENIYNTKILYIHIYIYIYIYNNNNNNNNNNDIYSPMEFKIVYQEYKILLETNSEI